MEKVARLDKDLPWDELSLVLTDDADIQEINREHFASDAVTDVISFRYDPVPGVNNGRSGEIVVNVQRAIEKGNELAKRGMGRPPWTPSRELALYIAHGCDHLSGAEDADAAGRKRMRRRELRWLKEAEGSGLLENLLK